MLPCAMLWSCHAAARPIDESQELRANCRGSPPLPKPWGSPEQGGAHGAPTASSHEPTAPAPRCHRRCYRRQQIRQRCLSRAMPPGTSPHPGLGAGTRGGALQRGQEHPESPAWHGPAGWPDPCGALTAPISYLTGGSCSRGVVISPAANAGRQTSWVKGHRALHARALSPLPSWTRDLFSIPLQLCPEARRRAPERQRAEGGCPAPPPSPEGCQAVLGSAHATSPNII